MAGPAPPPYAPPAALYAPPERPAVALPLPAAVPPAPATAAMLPPPSAAVTVSITSPTPGKGGSGHAGSKRPRSPESAQEPPAKRTHATSTPETPSHVGATHLLSHADAGASQGVTPTGSQEGLTCAAFSESPDDMTNWQAPLPGSAGSVTQASVDKQPAEK